MKLTPRSVETGLDGIIPAMRKSHANLSLRTKFLLSLVLIAAGLTCGTLLVVRHAVQEHVRQQIAKDAHNLILTFQVVQRQHQMVLGHKADLLAWLALMRDGDATTIQDASEAPWQSEDCDLFALADRTGRIVALHTTIPGFPVPTAEEMLRRSLRQSNSAGWWFTGTRLYHVVLQPFYDDAPLNNSLSGIAVVGREIDTRAASDLRRISSSHVVFRYGGDIVVSTLSPFEEQEVAQQLRDRSASEQIQIGNERFFASSVDLTPGSHPAVSLTVLKPYSEAMASLDSLNHLLLGLGFLAAIAGTALASLISGTFTRPLANLVEGVRALERGDFTYPLEAQGGDEVAQLTRTFDQMRSTLQKNEAQKQELEGQLRQAQKMEALGRLAGGVAHDFNNLLTVIKGHSDLLLEGVKPASPLHGSSQEIQKAADRAASLTRQLLAFSRKQALQPRVLDLNVLIAEMGKLLTRLIREDIEFAFRPGESLDRVKADPGQIEQVILNLIINACDAMLQGGKLTIETHNVEVDEEYARTHPPIETGNYVLLVVTDTGHGMNPETKERIFEPFFTTKEQGTGLGLAIVYGVVKQSGGFIWVESAQGNGTRFEIYLPRADQQAKPTPPEKIIVMPAHGSETVLVVEDEGEVRALACEFLRSAGYSVLTAADGTEALKMVEHRSAPIHVLVTDVVMPKLRGPELARKLKRLLPDLRIVYMSGYLERNQEGEEFLEGAFFLQKPFSRDLLVRQVSSALGNGRPKQSNRKEAKVSANHRRSRLTA